MLETYLIIIQEKLIFLFFILAADVAFGVTHALIHREFQWVKLVGVIETYIPFVLAWLLGEALIFAPPELSPLLDGLRSYVGMGLYSAIILRAVANILSNMQALGVFNRASIFGIPPKVDDEK